jgi:hypothetical protein
VWPRKHPVGHSVVITTALWGLHHCSAAPSWLLSQAAPFITTWASCPRCCHIIPYCYCQVDEISLCPHQCRFVVVVIISTNVLSITDRSSEHILYLFCEKNSDDFTAFGRISIRSDVFSSPLTHNFSSKPVHLNLRVEFRSLCTNHHAVSIVQSGKFSSVSISEWRQQQPPWPLLLSRRWRIRISNLPSRCPSDPPTRPNKT